MVTNIGYKNTDIGVIPKDWDCIHLCTLGKLLSGLTYTPEDVKNYGLLVLRSSNIQEGRLCFKDNVYVNCKIEADKYVKQGDLLICVRNGSRALIGKCALIDKNYNATFGAFMALFRSPHGKYLYQLFSNNTIQEQINRNCGATINQITSADFNRFLVAFPQNPKEQAAISEALSDVDNLTSSLQKLIEKKKAIKQGAMQELLTGKKRLPGFSGKRKRKKLGNYIKFEVGFPFKSQYFNSQHIGLRLIKNRDLKSDDQVYYTTEDVSSEYIVNNGDVLVGMDGDFTPCIWRKGVALLNQRVGRIGAFGMDLLFSYYLLQQPLQELQIGTGATTVKHLSHFDVEELELTFPEEIKEQQAIAQVLSDMDNDIEQLEKKLAKYQQIKQGMMQELLTGRIRLV